jgi:anion transporter
MQLNDIDMFKELSAVEQSRLFGRMDKLEFAAGSLVFEQGEAGDSMYVIDDGSIELFTMDEGGIRNTLTVLNSGDAFGEMSLLTDTSRTASAIAACRSTLYKLGAETFNELLVGNTAIANYFLRMLSERLKQTDITLQKAESSQQRLLESNLAKLPEDIQKVILAASLLPLCTVDFLTDYFQIAALDSLLEQYGHLYPHILSWDECTACITIPDPVSTQLRELYQARFDSGEMTRLVIAAAHSFLATEQWEKAVHVYAENRLWSEACATAEIALVRIVKEDALRTAVVEHLAHCPDEILFKHYNLLLTFLEVCLSGNTTVGLNKLESALSSSHEYFPREQKIILYQKGAEYCNKLGLQQKSLEYVNMALNMAESLGRPNAGNRAPENIDHSRAYQLHKQRLRSAMGVTLALKESRSLLEKSKIIPFVVGAIAIVVIVLFHSIGPVGEFSGEAMLFIGISVAAVILWIVDIIPSYIVALLMILSWVLLKLVEPDVALSGFASPTWMYMLCTLALGAAIAKSGLLYRLSLYVLKAFPKNQTGQLLGFAVSGLVLNPLIPSSTAKVSLSTPIAQGVAEAMGFPDQSNGSAGLGLGTMVFYGFMTPFFLTGSSFNVMVLGLMPGKPNISWIDWFFYSLPTLILFSVGMYFVIALVFKPEKVKKKLSKDVLNEQLRILGKVSREEWITSIVTVAVILMLVLQSLHGIDSVWILLAGFCCLVIGGVLDTSTFKSGVDWPFLLFSGVFFSFAKVLDEMGLVAPMTNLFSVVMQPFMSSSYLFLLAATLITFFLASTIREDATAILLTVAMCPIAQGIGIHPWVLVLVILLASDPFFYASQSTTYLTAYYSTEEKSFSHRQGQKLSLYLAVMTVLAIVLSIPFWQLMGLIR